MIPVVNGRATAPCAPRTRAAKASWPFSATSMRPAVLTSGPRHGTGFRQPPKPLCASILLEPLALLGLGAASSGASSPDPGREGTSSRHAYRPATVN